MFGVLNIRSTLPVAILLTLLYMSGLPRPVHAQCELPSDLVGNWYRIIDDVTITFTSSGTEGQVFVEVYSGAYDCYESSGNRYVFVTRTTVSNPFGDYSKGYFCWELIQVTDFTVVFYHLTANETAGAFYKLPAVGVREGLPAPSLSEVCSLSSSTELPSLLFKIPSGVVSVSDIATAQRQCSPELFHVYSYVKDGTDCVGTNSQLDFCQDRSSAHVNYTACDTKILYSQDGVLSCLAHATVGDAVYQVLVNQDATVDSSTYVRFVCMKVETGKATVYPKRCDGPGQELTLTITESCPITDETDVVIIVVAVVVSVVALAAIIVTVILLYKCVYLKRKNAAVTPANDKPVPNGNSVHTEEGAVGSGEEEHAPAESGRTEGNDAPGRLPPLNVDTPRTEALRQ